MSNKVHDIVASVKKSATGGQEFFELLDMGLCHESVFEPVYDMIHLPHRQTFLLTGTFGKAFLRWMHNNAKPNNGYILWPGGMRGGICKNPLAHHLKQPDFWQKHSVFVDDSIYSGSTFGAIQSTISASAKPKIYVAYDGTNDTTYRIKSLYRYWNHHEKED